MNAIISSFARMHAGSGHVIKGEVGEWADQASMNLEYRANETQTEENQMSDGEKQGTWVLGK